MMAYPESSDCILWILLAHTEGQESGNDCESCILRILGGDRLQIVINSLLAASLGKRQTETLARA